MIDRQRPAPTSQEGGRVYCCTAVPKQASSGRLAHQLERGQTTSTNVSQAWQLSAFAADIPLNTHLILHTYKPNDRRSTQVPPVLHTSTSHQILVQHAELEVGEEVGRGEVDGLLVARESHLVLPLALVGAAEAAEDLAAGGVHLQTSGGRGVRGDRQASTNA